MSIISRTGHLAVLALLAACSSATMRPAPPPPESCPTGMVLVCTETTASEVQPGESKFCRCRMNPSL